MATAQAAIDRARYQLHDADAVRWSDAELLAYLNDGLRQIVTIKPEANTLEALFTPADTSALQTLPAGGVKFIKATFNEAAGGGKTASIRFCEKDVLDTFLPGWSSDAPIAPNADSYYEHYMHDPRDPTRFYLYPQPAPAYPLWIMYTAVPTELTLTTDTFPLADQYLEAASQYIVYRALTKEGRYSVGPEARRRELWEAFLTVLGVKRQVTREVSPDTNRPPEAPA